jgi:micrococcal nuclease
MRGADKEAGKIARDYMREQVLDKRIKLYTIKDKKGKYGRWLGILYKDGVNLNQLMVDEGLAKLYML